MYEKILIKSSESAKRKSVKENYRTGFYTEFTQVLTCAFVCANSAKLKKKKVNSVYDKNNSKPCLTKQLLNRFMLGMIGQLFAISQVRKSDFLG